MLPQEAIAEFKELYHKRYGVELNDAEASFRANRLFDLFRTVYGSSDGFPQPGPLSKPERASTMPLAPKPPSP